MNIILSEITALLVGIRFKDGREVFPANILAFALATPPSLFLSNSLI
jgi:hypothetical protein